MAKMWLACVVTYRNVMPLTAAEVREYLSQRQHDLEVSTAVRQYKERALAGRGHAYTDEARVNELERMVDWRTTL